MERTHRHDAIQCDGCGMDPIRGLRFKCGNCKNYDLCSICIDSTQHDESHVFLRIKKPLEQSPTSVPLLKDILYDKKRTFIYTGTISNPMFTPDDEPSLVHSSGPLRDHIIQQDYRQVNPFLTTTPPVFGATPQPSFSLSVPQSSFFGPTPK